MKQESNDLARSYTGALRRHLNLGVRTTSEPALRLGRRAAMLGMEPLDLARVHEDTAAALKLSNAGKRRLNRAELFFYDALAAIVETQPAAQQSKRQLARLAVTVSRRTVELASANRRLERGIIRRKSVEVALKKSGLHYSKLLKDSLQLQQGLRRLAHKVLAAQESERMKISRMLQNEIAQTLLGINVRRLALAQEARTNTRGLPNEIASARRTVAGSARSVRRVAGEFKNA